jgi:hypothetical protein
MILDFRLENERTMSLVALLSVMLTPVSALAHARSHTGYYTPMIIFLGWPLLLVSKRSFHLYLVESAAAKDMKPQKGCRSNASSAGCGR